MLGTILSSRYGQYEVLVDDQVITCKPLGIFRHLKIKPLVGDKVEIKDNTINNIYSRKNFLYRPSIANVDEVAIVMSIKEPMLSTLLIDKFLSYANFFHIPSIVIISKADKIDDEKEIIRIKNALAKLNVTVVVYSKFDKNSIIEVKKLFLHKIVVLMGQTGVGKSTLLNALIPSLKREVGEYSLALGRGKHQTKEVILIPCCDGFIADTPGFSSLELPFFKEDLAHCFTGFAQYANHCKYTDCLHVNEQGCKVKEALKETKIDELSYENYLKILGELKMRKDRYV